MKRNDMKGNKIKWIEIRWNENLLGWAVQEKHVKLHRIKMKNNNQS